MRRVLLSTVLVLIQCFFLCLNAQTEDKALTPHQKKVEKLCQKGKAIDIWSTKPYPSNVLSNLYDWPFEFDGVKCGSIEGFLQAIKSPDIETQKRICAMDGHTAKKHSTSEWKKDQTVYWKDESFKRQSKRFYELLSQAYDAMASQNPDFVKALHETDGKRLFHCNGKADPTDTILTEKEFCKELLRLRKKF